MRTIKFRAYDKTENKMYQDVGIKQCGVEVYENQTDFPPKVILDRGRDCFELMQFIGLVDKCGNEIYEGDIISMDSWEPKNCQVKFIEGAFCLAFLGGEYDGDFSGDIHYIHHADRAQATIIGNIYQNPELCAR